MIQVDFAQIKHCLKFWVDIGKVEASWISSQNVDFFKIKAYFGNARLEV
ncbi:MAG: hypothetical protein ABI417_06255 [Coleofasciculaceae cyanobacterium]|jgi:hypothetical protein